MRFLVLLLLLIAAPARAQDRAEVALSLDDALSQASEHAPSVAASAARAAVAHADTGIAGMFPNPRLGIGGGLNYLVVADFFVLLPIFGQRETAEAAATAEERVVESGIEVTRLDARLAAALAFADLWLAEQEAAASMDDATRRTQLHDIAVARFEERDTMRLDVVRTEAEQLRAEAEAAALSDMVQAFSARLAGTLGSETDTIFRTSGAPLPERATAPSDGELDEVLAAHPVAERVGLSLHAADAVVDRTHRARFPLLGLSISDWVNRATESSDFRVLVTMELPIFDEPRIERAEASREVARADAEVLMVGLRAGLLAARAEYRAVSGRCEAERERVLPAAREAAELSMEAYQSGTLDLASTLVAEQLRSDAERRSFRCDADRARAWARLEHAMGGPL